MSKVRYIGIDFGTSTSVLTYLDYEKQSDGSLKAISSNPIPLSFDQNSPVVPTVIIEKEPPKEKLSFGWKAYSDANFYAYLKKEFKMDLLDKNKREEAERLVKMFLNYIAEEYKRKISEEDIEDIHLYVSYPVKWPSQVRKFMIDTADAVFNASRTKKINIHGMDEPRAAMQYCLSTPCLKIKEESSKNITDIWAKGEDINILLIDMGAGTTDIVVYKYVLGDDTKNEVLATYPPVDGYTFGGREVDEKLLEFYFNAFGINMDSVKPFQKITASLSVKSHKETIISSQLWEGMEVENPPAFFACFSMMGSDDADCRINDYILKNKILGDYLRRFPELINGALSAAGISGDEVDLVICTGGHSQWYFIRDMLMGGKLESSYEAETIVLDKIQSEPWRIINTEFPQQTVSMGMSMMGIPIGIKARGSNSVWLKFDFLNVSQIVKVMDKGKMLPYSNSADIHFEYKYNIGDDIDFYITPFVGGGLESAMELKKVRVNAKLSGWIKAIDRVAQVITLGSYTGDTAKVQINVKASFDENELLVVNGLLKGSWLKEDIPFSVKM